MLCLSSSSTCLPSPALSKYEKSFRKRFATFRLNLQKSRLFLLASIAAAITPFAALFLVFGSSFTDFSTRLSTNPLSQPDIYSTHYVDPCELSIPQPLIHFDPSARVSAEFRDPVAADVDPPALNRVFTTFFSIYLFQPNSDIVVNLTDTGRGRPTDIRDGLHFAEKALQRFHKKPSIKVDNYSLGYSHLDRVRGSRYIFHLISSDQSNHDRHDVVAIQRTFDGRCYLSVKEYESAIFERTVYILVPYSERPKRLKWFLDQFDDLREKDIPIKLILAACKDIRGNLAVAYALVSDMQFSEDVKVLPVAGDRTGFFSRAIALREGAALIPNDNIIFICDVDMYIYPTMFDSCRHNAIQNSQVYFPVFYSLYARSSRIDKNGGYWRDTSYGMSCMYKSDFAAVAPYDQAETKFVGWGGEDYVLDLAFKNDSRYTVFRAIEPALRHKWHTKHCEPFTPAYEDCLSVKFQQLGPMASVGKFLMQKKFDTESIFAQYADEDDDGRDPPSQKQGNATEQDQEDIEKRKRRRQLLERNHHLLMERNAQRERERLKRQEQQLE